MAATLRPFSKIYVLIFVLTAFAACCAAIRIGIVAASALIIRRRALIHIHPIHVIQLTVYVVVLKHDNPLELNAFVIIAKVS